MINNFYIVEGVVLDLIYCSVQVEFDKAETGDSKAINGH